MPVAFRNVLRKLYFILILQTFKVAMMLFNIISKFISYARELTHQVNRIGFNFISCIIISNFFVVIDFL